LISTQPHLPVSNQAEIKKVILQMKSNKAMFSTLIPTAALVPVVAALVSIIIYLSLLPNLTLGVHRDSFIAVYGGTLLVVLGWMVIGIFRQGAANVNRADSARYEMIIRRLIQIASWLDILGEPPSSSNCPGFTGLCEEAKRLKPLIELNKREACDAFSSICESITSKRRLSWVLGSGYLDIWRKIHRIDEAFIYLEPRELVIYDALHDESSLTNASIGDGEDLLAKLRTAVTALDTSVTAYLKQQALRQVANTKGNAILLKTSHNPGQASLVDILAQAITSQTTRKCPVCSEHRAKEALGRTILKEVRFTLHQFRDDRWEKLLRARKLLIKLTIFASISTYILLEFAILAGAKPETLIAVTTFYLVGVTVALFNRLYDQSKSDVSLDDFNLATVRIVAAVVFAGLAAVGGVLVQNLLVPSASSSTNFSSAFNLSLPSIFVAAAFGLTPSLFVTAIQKQTDQYKLDLKSTETVSCGTRKTTISA
jgi:hypothetical protein